MSPKPLCAHLVSVAIVPEVALLQGPAFTGILEGTYYAAASLFTKPRPDKAASVRFNFGPDFKFGPPVVEGLPQARPFCEVPPKPPPVPDEDGTVTVGKTVVAVVKPPPDDGPAQAPDPPLATATPEAKPGVKGEPVQEAGEEGGGQADGQAQEPDRGQGDGRSTEQQVDVGSLDAGNSASQVRAGDGVAPAAAAGP